MIRAVPPLVSVVVPCCNQARFLADAIESILAQSHPALEIVVVDDGSIDESAAVASRYAGVVVLRQPNRGRCAARNAGAARARGEFLVFLDADDRLLPAAVEAGLTYLLPRAECALVAGHRVVIDADGRRTPEPVPGCVDTTDYLSLLQTNFILTPAVAMFRRTALMAAGGWNEALHTSEDYELYLRIARRWPISCHHQVVAEYRRHGANTSADARRMLASTLAVVRLQRDHAYARPGGMRAYRSAIVGWWRFWAAQLVDQMRRRWRAHDRRGATADLGALLGASLPVFAMRVGWKVRSLLSRWTAAHDGVLAPPQCLEARALQRGEHQIDLGGAGERPVRFED